MPPFRTTSQYRAKETPSARRPALFVAALLWMGMPLSIPVAAGASQEPSAKTEVKAPSAAPAGSQAPPAVKTPAANSPSQIRVRVEVVSVAVSVLDKSGHPVIDLGKNDFEVYEDGTRQTISYFSREPKPPLRVGLILDTSNSARQKLQFEKEAATEFIFTMLKGDNSKNQILLETFDASSAIVQDFSSDPGALNEKVLALKAGGGKALYDAIYLACKDKMLKAGQPEGTRRVLVVISDGLDLRSEHTLEEAISMAHRAETVIYTIDNSAYGYSNPAGKILERLSADTGGALFTPLEATPGTDLATGYLSHGQIGDTSQNTGLGAATGTYSAQRLIQLADSMEAISRELDEQYNIGYRPANDALDGTYRSIRVVALRKGVQVRSKTGYFAAAEQ